MMTRRQAIKTTALAGAALATLPGAIAQTTTANRAADNGYRQRPVHTAATALRLRRAGTAH